MKRYRTAIWRRALAYRGLLLLMAVALTLAMSSCTKESLGNSTPSGDGVEVRVTFPRSEVTKATTDGTEEGSAEENRLDRVTIFIFNEDGTRLENVLSEDVTSSNSSLATSHPKWASDQTLLVKPLVNPSLPKKIYAIANWSKTAFDKATYTETMLKDELTTITAVANINGAAAYPMLMSGSKAVANVTSLFYNVTVDMERQSSKIRANLSITTAVQNLMPQIEWQTDLMKITVANVPDKSYIVGRNALPATATLLNSIPTLVDDAKPAAADQTVPASKDLRWSHFMYITENPVVGATPEAKAKSTYIVVQLPYKNRITGTVEYDNYYKLYVNDTRDAASPHKVLRNTIYNFNISILGMGLPINNLVPDVNVDDQLTVNSWEKGEIGNVEFPTNNFNINTTQIALQYAAESHASTIVTDVADWKLVKEDGSTMFSFADGIIAPVIVDGITYTLSGNASVATVDVSKPVTTAAFSTQAMFFEAKNLKVPFTVVCDNGFIPNSVLQAAGWPVAILPIEGGLQVATRGDKVLPGGTPAAADPMMQWKTSETTTSGVELVTSFANAKLGMGKSSTDAMTIPSQVGLHPAAAYCRAMGPEWYLPSVAELKLIYNNVTMLGASYSFNANSYWSATENNSSNSWYVSFYNGSTNTNYKTYTYRVRCVKGTPPPPPSDSYIPTSVLAAAGWPADRLPVTGLQVATRGDKVQPGGTPAADDPMMQWKTSETTTSGVELVTSFANAKLGMGKSSTDAMTIPSQVGLHPAAAYCRAMGPEWYLPSVAELKLIYNNVTMLGASYSFSASLYWSATEYNSSISWNVNFYIGYTLYNDKTIPNLVRCLREI